MKGYLISDLPVKVDLEAYQHAVDRVVESLGNVLGCSSVYRIGSVGAPGISDLDLVVVAKDNASLSIDLRKTMTISERYLFIHDLYGSSASLFLEGQRFSFFRPYRLIRGEDILFGSNFPEPDPAVRRQVALEYLIRFYFSVTMQKAYKLLRVRSLLLNAKGASIDIEYLSPSDIQVRGVVRKLKSMREDWFKTQKPPVAAFIEWFEEMAHWLEHFMTDQLSRLPFYLPDHRSYSLGRNIGIIHGDSVKMMSKVSRYPMLHPFLGKKYFNLLNRYSNFQLSLPFIAKDIPEPVRAYFNYNQRHRDYNKLHLPHYLPLTSSFNPR